jgi:hypothetical protein
MDQKVYYLLDLAQGHPMVSCIHMYLVLGNQKKLDRGGKDRLPGIILRGRNILPDEKTFES